MNDYPNPSTNIPNAWSQAAQQQQNTSSFNNYTLNTKWSTHTAPNQTQSGTPTNPSALTAFPSFGGNIPPLYPSISAQSSNSIQGGAPSPFGPQNTNNATLTAPQQTNHGNTNGIAGHHSKGGMTKLHINTSYNPYNAGFTPNDFNNAQATTPNIPNSNGTTPTGFKFNNYSNPYSNIATPTTPLNATPINRWNTNALQQTAAMNNLNAMNMNMNMNYQLIGNKYVSNNAQKATTPNNLSANSSFGALPHLSNPSSANNKINSPQNNEISNIKDTKLNSNAIPYQPQPHLRMNNSQLTQNAINTALKGNIGGARANNNINEVMKSQQLQHQQKAERVPYSYPSYAEAVNKVSGGVLTNKAIEATVKARDENVNNTNTNNPPTTGVNSNTATTATTATEMSSESQEAIQKLNPLTWPCNPRHSKFYVIKSFGEDDVHKSIKYNLWCSTERGNRKLDEAFNESKRINAAANNNNNGDKDGNKSDKDVIDPRDTTRGCPVYLFFSVNRSGCFCGMAQMISNYYKDRHFGSWVQDGKWQGSFIVKWIYVKDIPNKDLKDITLPNNDNRPVTFSRDTQEIPFSQGIEMLRRFIKYEPKTNILQDFKYYDDRERDIKNKRTQQIILQQLQPQGNTNMPPQMQQAQSNMNNMNAQGNINMNMNNMNNNINTYQSHFNRNNNMNSARNKYNAMGNQNSNLNAPNNNGNQIEGYSTNRYNNYSNQSNKRNHNNGNKHFSNQSYQQKRKYYPKNERQNNQNNQRNKYYGNNNRYNQNQSNQSQPSQYGNFQILKRNPITPGNDAINQNNNPMNNQQNNPQNNMNNNQSKDNNTNNQVNKSNDIDNINDQNANNNQNRGRYNNNNRNRWVRK